MTQSYTAPEVLVMADIESLDVGPRSIVSQIGMVFAPASDPETILKEVLVYLPIQPQIDLNRTLSASTLVWWMKQSDEARKEFEQNTGDDHDELAALLRHVNRQFDQVVDGREYELFARGPQFDITNIESLMADCAVKPTWRYDRIRDLRTVMALAGLRTQDVPRDTTRHPEHMAVADCNYQFQCLTAALRQIRARS
jgi:hypothetical protein